MTKDLYSQFEDFQNQDRNAMQVSQDSNIEKKETDLYSEFEAFQNSKNVSSMKASVFSSAPINPDQAAQQYQMSKRVNLPVDIIRTKESEIKQMTELNSIDYDAIAKNFPAVAKQLSDPNKSGAIRDDVDKLSYFERISQGYKTSKENTELAPLYVKQMLADIGNEKFKLTPTEENQLAFIEQEQQENQPSEYKNKGGLLQEVATFAKNIPIYTAQAIPTILANIPATLGGAATGAGIGATVTRTPAGAITGAGVGARAGTFLGAAQLETGLAYKELKDLVDENGNPIEKTAAAGGAIATGVVNGLLELVPFEAAIAPIKKAFSREGVKQIAKTGAGREYLKNIGGLALAEGATEGIQEFFNIAFGEVAKAASKGDFTVVGMKDANDTEGLLKFLSDSSQRVMQSAEAGLGAGIGLGAVTSGATYAKQTYDQKKQGKAQQEQIKEITQNVKESKTFNRSQELFKDVTEKTLGQQNVYISAEKVQTYFQDKTPQEVEEFYKQVPEAREQMQDAIEVGGNLILKGNNAYVAFAQDAYAPLQDFASLSPEFINDEAYQDAFLQDVVSNVNYDETINKIRTEQDIANKNIEKQIQNLGMPYRDAKDLSALIKAFYETNLKKYGNEQATKLLDNYFKNLEIKNEVYVDDVAKMLKKARKPQKSIKAGKPLIKSLKEKGGVMIGSNLAGELNALDITPKTAPRLFKKDGGIGDVDNFPVSEFADRFPELNFGIEGDYVNRKAMLDLIADETRGVDISQVRSEEQEQVDNFIQQLDELGLDLNAPDEEIKKAIDEYRKGGYNQEQTKTPAFKKWFGDSKVVDENGKPLVVYHGTTKSFDKFKKTKGSYGEGVYLTADANYASEYAGVLEAHIKDKIPTLEEGFNGGNIMPVYAKINNPISQSEFKKIGFDTKKAKKLGHDGFISNNNDFILPFEPSQIKSAIGNKGTFDPENANILFQNQAPTFYSALEKQITDLPQGKGSPEQWAGIIKNLTQKGVKQEELDWTGIEDWIKEQKGSVTKEQIVDYLKANQIQVEEVIKGAAIFKDVTNTIDEEKTPFGDGFEKVYEGNKARIYQIGKNEFQILVIFDGQWQNLDTKKTLDSAKKRANDVDNNTEFSKYTLVGGENYRELLLTLPEKKSSGKQFTLKEERGGDYKSSHYEEPNILAHIRFNERTDKDGARVMFIEELQSDWHQEGRRKGYNQPPLKIDAREWTAKFFEPYDETINGNTHGRRSSWKIFDKNGNEIKSFSDETIENEQQAIKLAASLVQQETNKKAFNGVPDAPFKTTWNELAFKRALLWAVENGFDKVAWTTGEQQAERYDLSEQIDSVVYDNEGVLTAYDKTDKQLINKRVSENELEDYIGKEAAKKLIKTKANENGKKILENADLKVGGEGMKGFYDKILPTTVNKLVKKFGGKVETTKIEDVGEVWSLDITPAMQETISKQGLPLFQKSTTAPRGQFKYLQGKPIISLFQDKNKSTLLHELGHTFLEIQKELSQIPEISEEATKDWKVLEDWLDIKDGNITVEAHEKFARGFEAYLREGKAPSVELRTAFARFFTWLSRIYKDVLQLNVKLNNEVREVFDRMLATQEAIDAQKNNPLFRVDDQVLELLNAEEKEDYLKISENAGLKARETLTKKALRQKEKENTKFYKQQRAAVKSEIRQAMEESPTYRALNFFKTGELYGAEEQIEAYKLNKEEAQSNYLEFYKKLKNKGIFEKDGVSLDIAAEDFGFKDGGVMLNNLSSAKLFNNELRRATDEEMVSRFGDMLYDGTIEEEAKDAMQNAARANKILYELNGINRKVKSYVENKEAYKQKAQEIFAKKPLSVATDSNQFYIVEVKAARETGKALGKKDYEKAVAEKKKQLLNHYLYRESLQLKKELQAAYKKYGKYKKRPAQGKVVIEEEYREKIVELLANFGLAKMPEGVEFSVAALEAWKQEQAAKEIFGLVEFPEIQDFVNKPFKQLTADEFRTLNDAVENLAFIGKEQRFIEIEGKKIELRGLSNSIIEKLEDIKIKKQSIGRPSKTEEAKELFDAYMATIIKAKEIAIDIDGGKFGGKFYNSFIDPLASGELKRNKMIKEATKKFLDLREQYLKSVKLNKKTLFKLIDKSLDKEAAISIALNWGNEKNRKRIKDGYGWNNSQVNEIISSLTENEWRYVEEIWKFINSYQKDAYAVQKKLTGFTPRIEKALPFSVKTSDGVTIQLQGGYYPIMYIDKTKLGAQIKEQINSPVGSNLSLYKSYTKERSDGKVDKQVNLTLLPAVKHIADVINDIALKEAAWSSSRLLNYPPLRKILKEKIGDIPVETLQVWLEDMFGVTSSYAGIVERILDHIRIGTTISALGASIATTIIQIPGFVQAMPDIGYLNMIKGIYKFIGNANPLDINANRKKALEKSKILQSRAQTFNQAIYDVLKDMAGKGTISRNAIPFFFYPMQVAQSIPDTIVWYGAYSKGLKDFNGDDAKAVKYADYIVVKTQGSGLTQDLSAIERGSLGNVRRSKFIKLFTAFGTYFVAKFNVSRRSFKDTNFKNPVHIAKFMSDMIALYIIEAIAGEIILNRIPDFDDDDEDAYAGYVFKTMMQTFASQFFLGREVVGLSKGYDGTPSGFGGLKKAYQGGEDVFEQTINAFTDKDIEMTKIIKGANKSASVIMHFPSTPIDTLVSAYEKEKEGKDVALIDYFIKPRKK